MHFLPSDEESAFARSLDALLSAAAVPDAVRAWSRGDHGPGRALFAKLADTGMFALAVPERYEGLGPLPVAAAVAFTELGRHAVPGPLVEGAAASVLLGALAAAGVDGPAKRFLPELAAGTALATLTLPGGGPYALDADAAAWRFTVTARDELYLSPAGGAPLASTDPARRLFWPEPGGELLAAGAPVAAAAAEAGRWARLLTAAQCLGVGEALLARTVAYVRERRQFGAPVGSFQAVKHRLADTLLGVEFARPLVWAAAVSPGAAEVAAAKLSAGEAVYRTARTALQLHGAIGYTDELDLSLWLRKARPLRDAWGTPSACRATVLPA
ncbi:acyl-CoA dehydrogenase family protein [Streptomyces bambusae]|uniref:acyl-CoA dehydrogenase family protein n=1 Tax=Streptomyces bambusae TaxID=1550616 RepID=UPI001CFC855B|nr:acyl-CoA dehydrogenase family protein [Streptomyces bambusae]MCB5167796.1 acyl-CoA dehydrogenase family protein [Streptomyces bambusae]